MFVVGLFSWWYGRGWKQHVIAVRAYIAAAYDYFSFELLVRTLFAPFRQISAGGVRGPIGVQLRAWFDRLISRIIGTIVRSGLLIIGIVTLGIMVVVGAATILLWAFVPLAPVVGVVLAMIGWMPWRG